MIPVRKNDIAVGFPLPWPVFDGDRRLLLRAGFVIESPAQLDVLSRRGLYRTVGGGAGAYAAGTDVIPDEPAEDDKWRRIPFGELRLPIGTRVTVQKLDPDDDTRYNARLHGVFRDVSIIINVPSPGGSLAMFKQGQPLLLRAFSGTDVFAFTSDVLMIRYHPAAYLHLQYPRIVEGTSVRRAKRVNVRLIASVSPCGDDQATDRGSLPAQVSDLSSGGARLSTKTSLGDPGDEIALAFRLRTSVGEATLKLEAALRSCDRDEGRVGFVHGVQFVRVQPLEQLALEGFIANAAAAEEELQ